MSIEERGHGTDEPPSRPEESVLLQLTSEMVHPVTKSAFIEGVMV
jgi:hypothetical protein